MRQLLWNAQTYKHFKQKNESNTRSRHKADKYTTNRHKKKPNAPLAFSS